MASCESSPYRTAQLLTRQCIAQARSCDVRRVHIGWSQVGFGSKRSPLPVRFGSSQVLGIEFLAREVFGPICGSHLASLLNHLDRPSSLILPYQLGHSYICELTVLAN